MSGTNWNEKKQAYDPPGWLGNTYTHQEALQMVIDQHDYLTEEQLNIIALAMLTHYEDTGGVTLELGAGVRLFKGHPNESRLWFAIAIDQRFEGS